MAAREMMSDSFFDTNIFLYAARPSLCADEERKRLVALDLITKEDFAISAQVLAEFYYNAVKEGKQKLPKDEAEFWLESMCERPCANVDIALVRDGVRLSRRYEISYWDGAIIAAAHDLGATKLYSEDLNDGQIYGTVKVVNPFKSIPN
jgi:predicted nucleic acid-binding protein